MKFQLNTIYYCTHPEKVKKIKVINSYFDSGYWYYNVLILDNTCPDRNRVRTDWPESLLVNDGYFSVTSANNIWREINA